jgi:hypothetical protein
MDPSKMENLIALMKPDQIQDALRAVDEYERWGGMSPEEADEWRRRILERQKQLELDPSDAAGAQVIEELDPK